MTGDGATAPVAHGGRERLRKALFVLGALVGLWIPVHFVLLGLIHRYYPGDFKLFWQIANLPIGRIWGDIPFSYLPTGMLLFAPLGLTGLVPAFVAFSLVGLALFFWAGGKLTERRNVMLAFLTGGTLGALTGGHVTLILFALAFAGLAERRPAPAGLLLSAAAMLKPQTVIALPFVLAALGRWRTIAWTALGCGLWVLLSCLLFGVDSWTRWLDQIHTFPTYLTNHSIDLEDRGLYGLFRSMGLSGKLYLLGLPLGLGAATLGARGARDDVERALALTTGTILLVPYTMPYDLAGIGLLAVQLLRRRTADPMVWIGAALVLTNYFAALGVVVLAYRLLVQARGGEPLSGAAA